jgi:hypothetical protein
MFKINIKFVTLIEILQVWAIVRHILLRILVIVWARDEPPTPGQRTHGPGRAEDAAVTINCLSTHHGAMRLSGKCLRA